MPFPVGNSLRSNVEKLNLGSTDIPPHTETPTAACAAVGVSSQSSIGFRRINPSDPGDRNAAPITRPLSDRALDTRCSCAGCRWLGPRHCCHRPLTVTDVRCCHRHVETIPGSRRSAVAGEFDFCLASGLLRSPVRLRGPRCFSTYTLSDCVRMSIGSRTQFSKRRKLLFRTRAWRSVGTGSEPVMASIVGQATTGTSRASGCKYNR